MIMCCTREWDDHEMCMTSTHLSECRRATTSDNHITHMEDLMECVLIDPVVKGDIMKVSESVSHMCIESTEDNMELISIGMSKLCECFKYRLSALRATDDEDMCQMLFSPKTLLVDGHLSLIKERIEDLSDWSESSSRYTNALWKSREDMVCIATHQSIAIACYCVRLMDDESVSEESSSECERDGPRSSFGKNGFISLLS